MSAARPGAQLRVLFQQALFLSFFGAARRRGERGGAPLTTALFAQSFAALVLVALLFPDTPPVRFAAATLSCSVALAVTTVLGDWRGDAQSQAEQAIVGTAPVPAGTRLTARLLHALFFVAAVTLATAIAPGVLSYWTGGGVLYAAAYFVAALWCASVAALLLVAVLQAAERAAGPRLALSIAASLRTVLLAGGFLGLALGLRAVRAGPEHFPGGRAALTWLPTWHAARLLELTAGRSVAVAGSLAWLLGLTALAVLAHGALLLWPARTERARRTAPRGLPWLLQATPAGAPRAFAGLCSQLLQRERAFRLRALPLLLLPFAMAALALGGDRDQGAEFLAVVQQFPAMYLPVLVPFLRGSEGHEARWIALTAPIDGLAAARRGAALALLRRLLLPVFVVLATIHALRQGPLQALATTSFALGLLLLLLPRVLRVLDVLPFSQDPDELGGGIDLGGMLFLALLLTAAGLLFHAARTAAPLAGWLGPAVLALGAWRLHRR